MRIPSVLLFAAASMTVTVLAEEAKQPERGGRMVFPPGALRPIETGSPTPAPAPGPRKLETPAEAIELFFLALKAGQVDAGYDALVRQTIIAERQNDVAALKERTKQAIDNYGPISGFEVVDEKTVGESLMRRTCISLNADLPLRWRFYFYKSGGAWRLVDLRVDDALVELFEDSGRAKK